MNAPPATPPPADAPMRAAPRAPGLRERIIPGFRQAFITAAGAWISYSTTVRFGLHEGFWAAISAIVVMQANLDDTRHSARDRFIGTAIGGLIAWGCASIWHAHVWIYALSVLITVFCCWVANIGNAGRLAAVTVTVIVLIPRQEPIGQVAWFRFLEVSWGIAVAVGIVSAFDWITDNKRSLPTA